MKRLHVAVGLIALGAVCSLVGCKESFKGGGGGYQPKPFAGPGDSPVVVRGGAMTIRTKDTTDGWVLSGAVYCTYIPTTTGLHLYPSGVDPITSMLPAIPVPPTPPLQLTGSWKVEVQGRKHLKGLSITPSGNGIRLRPPNSASECAPAPSGYVAIVLEKLSGNSDYYPVDSGVNEEPSSKEVAKRFQDITPSSDTSTNCYGPNANAGSGGDEDACERASKITVYTTGGPYYGRCTDGECILGIDK